MGRFKVMASKTKRKGWLKKNRPFIPPSNRHQLYKDHYKLFAELVAERIDNTIIKILKENNNE
jgi:hypothetical protein